MPARFWIEGTSGAWNDNDNWSDSSGGSGGSSFPIAGDDATFDDQGVGDMTATANIACDNILFTDDADYTGTWDADTFDVATGNFGSSSGGVVSGTCRLGSGTWTISGNFRFVFTGSFGEAAPITMTGTSKEMQYSSGADDFGPNVTIDSGATITCMGAQTFNTQGLTDNGSLTLGKTGSQGVIRNRTNAVALGNSSSLLEGLSGAFLRIENVAFTAGTGVTLTADLEFRNFTGTQTVVLPGITYGTVELQARGTTTYQLGGNASFDTIDFTEDGTRTLIVDNATNDPDITITGDVTVTSVSTFTWTKGTGTITASGTAAQSLDFESETIEDFILDKSSGTATLTDAVTTDSVTLTAGTLDIDGQILTCTGNFTAAANTAVNDTTTGGDIVIGGNLDINGTSGNTVTWSDANLDVTGTADADYTVASNSDASDGTEIDASDGTNTDGEGNTNWNFGGGGLFLPGGRNLTGIGAAGGPFFTNPLN